MGANEKESFNLKEIIEEAGINGVEFDALENERVGEAPILDNGLNLLYAPQGYGKSYTAISIAMESGLPALYIDLESNGKSFVDYCESKNVEYIYAGSADNVKETIENVADVIKKNTNSKALIIIDSYSDLFPEDEGKMAKAAQQALGDLHKYFMRDMEMPVLILDHATEKQEINGDGISFFKIEGNKSGKFKKTIAVLRLEKIDGNLDNGTYITVERSRNQEALPVGHTQYYRRNNYLVSRIRKKIEDGKLNDEFIASELENCLSGDDRDMWRKIRNDIAIKTKKERQKVFWRLKEGNSS